MENIYIKKSSTERPGAVLRFSSVCIISTYTATELIFILMFLIVGAEVNQLKHGVHVGFLWDYWRHRWRDKKRREDTIIVLCANRFF